MDSKLGAVARVFNHRLNGRSQIKHAVGVEKEHGDYGSNKVEIAHENDHYGDDDSNQHRKTWLRCTAQLCLGYPWHNPIIG